MSEKYDKGDGFSYNGEGLQSGQCGVTIHNVKASQNGRVTCYLGLESDEVTGNVKLTVARKLSTLKSVFN